MSLTPSYMIAPHDPIKMRYMKLREVPSGESSETRAHYLTVDILQNESGLHVLLSHPDWDPKGLGRDIENICSSLLILMDLNGLVKGKDKLFWYELSLFSFPKVSLHQIHFTSNGLLLATPHYESLPLEKAPFNLSPLIRRNESKIQPPIEEGKSQKIGKANQKTHTAKMKGKKQG